MEKGSKVACTAQLHPFFKNQQRRQERDERKPPRCWFCFVSSNVGNALLMVVSLLFFYENLKIIFNEQIFLLKAYFDVAFICYLEGSFNFLWKRILFLMSFIPYWHRDLLFFEASKPCRIPK